MSFMIGKSVYKSGGNKKNTFYLQSGSNVFRILPPMHSMALKGQWYKYWAVHKGFVNSAGKPRYFASIEEFDAKTKKIRVRDPICDKYRDNLAKAKAAKDKGYPEDKLKEFMDVYVKPYDTDKKFYVNAVSQDNKIGALALPIKLFHQLRALCEEYEAKGVDLTGTKGVYLNFKKIQAYKGDPQTSYSVEIYKEQMQVNGELFEKPKVHEITQAFVVQLENEAKDLNTLFTVPSATDLQLLADAQPNERSAIIDRIFGKSEVIEEDQAAEEDGVMGVTIPNTGGAKLVGSVGLSGEDLSVNLPSMPAAGPVAPAVTAQTQDFLKGATTPVSAAQVPAAQPSIASLAAAPDALAPTQAEPSSSTAGGSVDFDKMFESMFGGAK